MRLGHRRLPALHVDDAAAANGFCASAANGRKSAQLSLATALHGGAGTFRQGGEHQRTTRSSSLLQLPEFILAYEFRVLPKERLINAFGFAEIAA
jgi:hypothetical protein